MTMRSNTCPRCRGSMTVGFILDEAQGWRKTSDWIEGAPRKSLWTGLKLSGRQRFAIETWRCTRCGFLESYANA